ncbi:ATP-binding cassette domain-containing protein [Oceanobacillus picturae]|uniref:ATP-binding cassette domain-containing protein n=1 Tax=Oceanobacillus picturae TaxID=171693 RepID=UPI000E67CE82|nr:ABC transporter ATP-binding protein [Oceanobacillus picturae]RIU91956.1 ABC transporter ATP-binding protein [Oceanobacillus picturae]
MNVVECEKVTKKQGSVVALNELNIQIKKNTITGLIGRNGAGKTTLLKILSGLWRPTSGHVEVLNVNPFNSLTVSANVAYIDDSMDFPNTLTLSEILQAGKRFYGNWDSQLAERLFEYFSFHPDQLHTHLSKGKASTFNMIFGLAARCEITLFDEPTNGMDASVRKDFNRALLKDYLAHPRTMIISSHHLEELEELLEDILVIKNGKALLHEPIDVIRNYAIGLTGRSELVRQWVTDKQVLYTEEVGANTCYAVVKSEGIPLEKAKQLGMKVTPVSASDVCVYLTNRTTGGIDDVFK